MDWLTITCIIIVVGFLTYVLTVIVSLFHKNVDLTEEQIEALERQLEIEAGVIKNNVKADNMLDDPDYKRRMFDEDNS